MIAGKSVLGVITARGGSKGVPGKNILPIGGRPLLLWTVEAALASRYIDRLILSSDDPATIEIAVRSGCEAPFRRDPALATDEASSIDVLIDALNRVPGFDIVVLLQPTSPLRNTGDIDGVLEVLGSSDAPACVSLRAADHPFWTFQLDASSRLQRFVEPPNPIPSRRQDLAPAWSLNGAVYAALVPWFLTHRLFVSPQTVGYPMPLERSVDIDTPADIEHLRELVEHPGVLAHVKHAKVEISE